MSFHQKTEPLADIPALQQKHARVSGVTEFLRVADLVEDSLRLNSATLVRHEATLTRELPVEAPAS